MCHRQEYGTQVVIRVLFVCCGRECEKCMHKYILSLKIWPTIAKNLKRATSSIPRNNWLKIFSGWFLKAAMFPPKWSNCVGGVLGQINRQI